MKMTWKKLFKLIEEGYGQGHGNDYLPFLQIRRRNFSNYSNQSTGAWLFGYTREFHYHARGERLFALLLIWLGAKDVREQFPLWPIPHPHPVTGAPGSEGFILRDAPGLLDIASAANIEHGMFPGTQVPYVATMDLMATVYQNNKPRLVAVSCKPEQKIDEADVASRILERLELERLYLKETAIPYHLVDPLAFPRRIFANLKWLMPDDHITDVLLRSSQLRCFRDLLREHVYQMPIHHAIELASQSTRLQRSIANSAFRYLAWHQEIDIDIAQHVVMTLPAKPGGVALKRALQHQLFGEIDSDSL